MELNSTAPTSATSRRPSRSRESSKAGPKPSSSCPPDQNGSSSSPQTSPTASAALATSSGQTPPSSSSGVDFHPGQALVSGARTDNSKGMPPTGQRRPNPAHSSVTTARIGTDANEAGLSEGAHRQLEAPMPGLCRLVLFVVGPETSHDKIDIQQANAHGKSLNASLTLRIVIRGDPSGGLNMTRPLARFS